MRLIDLEPIEEYKTNIPSGADDNGDNGWNVPDYIIEMAKQAEEDFFAGKCEKVDTSSKESIMRWILSKAR